eukprot:891913-Rhodomonas_salina.1
MPTELPIFGAIPKDNVIATKQLSYARAARTVDSSLLEEGSPRSSWQTKHPRVSLTVLANLVPKRFDQSRSLKGSCAQASEIDITFFASCCLDVKERFQGTSSVAQAAKRSVRPRLVAPCHLCFNARGHESQQTCRRNFLHASREKKGAIV